MLGQSRTLHATTTTWSHRSATNATGGESTQARGRHDQVSSELKINVVWSVKSRQRVEKERKEREEAQIKQRNLEEEKAVSLLLKCIDK